MALQVCSIPPGKIHCWANVTTRIGCVLWHLIWVWVHHGQSTTNTFPPCIFVICDLLSLFHSSIPISQNFVRTIDSSLAWSTHPFHTIQFTLKHSLYHLILIQFFYVSIPSHRAHFLFHLLLNERHTLLLFQLSYFLFLILLVLLTLIVDLGSIDHLSHSYSRPLYTIELSGTIF